MALNPIGESPARTLVESLEHLAATARQQVAYLAELGALPLADELVMEFDDALRSPAGAAVSPRMQALLRELDSKLDSMSSDRSKWQAEALESDPDWLDVRRLAAMALREAKTLAR